MKTFILLVVLFSVAFAQLNPPSAPSDEPQHRFPKEYTTSFSELVFNDDCVFETVVGTVYASFPKKFIRVEVNANVDGETYSGSVFEDFNSGILYSVDHSTGDCTSQPLPFSGKLPFNLFNEMNYTTTIYLGDSATDVYTYNSPNYPDLMLEITLDRSSGIPVSTTFLNIANQQSPQILIAESLWNFSPQVPDFALHVPPNCQNSTPVEKRSASNQLIMKIIQKLNL
eukprot:TRINITY_DN303_c3_g1_i1.p1 TRINITY_DN303_c3_g1~~TRINITY_DN303_c3_g1_i1.p1  ORF type:complete len:227 (-),score=72.17 TRINITY_DN303_c3_g1_i1:122-802(-)